MARATASFIGAEYDALCDERRSSCLSPGASAGAAQDIFRAAFNHAFAAHSGDPRQGGGCPQGAPLEYELDVEGWIAEGIIYEMRIEVPRHGGSF